MDLKKKEQTKEKIEFLIDEMIDLTRSAHQKDDMSQEEFSHLQNMINKAIDLCEDNEEMHAWFLTNLQNKIDLLSQI